MPYSASVTRPAKIAIALAVVVLTGPIWGFELLYHVFLPANRPQLPATSDATPLEIDALWLEAGERLTTSQDVTPLWALNYFWMYRPGAAPRRGVQAVARITRLWAAQAWPASPRANHLRRTLAEMAVMVWLSRTSTVAALKRGLADQTYFGRSAYGIKAARSAYYGCSTSALTTARVAFLVGLPQNPSGFDPVVSPDLARRRRQYVLKSLAGAGVISETERAKAAIENAESAVIPKATACP